MAKPIIHFEGYGANEREDGILEVRGSYTEILTMLSITIRELCCHTMKPDDIMLAVVKGIREAKK